MNIGKYVIMTANNGETTVHIANTKFAHKMPLEKMISDFVEQHLTAVRKLFLRFDTEPVEALLDDPELMAVIHHMPDQDTVPGDILRTEEEVRKFHHAQLLHSYNSLHNTTIQMFEV